MIAWFRQLLGLTPKHRKQLPWYDPARNAEFEERVAEINFLGLLPSDQMPKYRHGEGAGCRTIAERQPCGQMIIGYWRGQAPMAFRWND